MVKIFAALFVTLLIYIPYRRPARDRAQTCAKPVSRLRPGMDRTCFLHPADRGRHRKHAHVLSRRIVGRCGRVHLLYGAAGSGLGDPLAGSAAQRRRNDRVGHDVLIFLMADASHRKHHIAVRASAVARRPLHFVVLIDYGISSEGLHPVPPGAGRHTRGLSGAVDQRTDETPPCIKSSIFVRPSSITENNLRCCLRSDTRSHHLSGKNTRSLTKG